MDRILLFIPMYNCEKQIVRVLGQLTDQVCSCVRWEESVRTMLEQGVDTFYEIGPGNVLKGLLARIAPEAKCICLGKAEDMEA